MAVQVRCVSVTVLLLLLLFFFPFHRFNSSIQQIGGVRSPSHAQQPEEEEDGHEQEEGVLPVAIAVVEVAVAVALVITCILVCSVKGIISVEDCGEEAEGECADAKRHVKAGVPETLEHAASALRLCSLSLRPRWSFQPGVLLAGAPSAVQRDDFLSADAGFTDGTLLSAGPRFQPLMKAGPAEQVTAHTDDSVPGSVQTNVTLEGGPVPLPFALPAAAAAAAARPVAVVAALPGRESSSAGRPAVTRGPGIRGRHDINCTR